MNGDVGNHSNRQPGAGQGAQFVYLAAAVAQVLTERLNTEQINLLANFLSVVTACVYAILAVEDPSTPSGP